MGLELVEGQDLVVRNQRLDAKTPWGLEPVHGTYCQIDVDFLGPKVFRPDS